MKTYKKGDTNKKGSGRIYTPTHIVDNILDLSGYFGNAIIKKHVIDNSCGDGAFLCRIVKRYCEFAKSLNFSKDEIRNDLSTYIHGIEIDPFEHRKCIDKVTETAMHYGIDNINWDILCGDALSIHKYDNMMDFVLGNPPYVRVHNLTEIIDSIKKYSFARAGMTDLFIVFYEVGIRMLNKLGVLGYITPSSFFNSLAGKTIRQVFCASKLLDKIVDLKHYQAFKSTSYTAIVILKKGRTDDNTKYYQFDETNQMPYYVDTLSISDYYISGNFFFAKKEELDILKNIYDNSSKSDISVKNGYATLCDDVFINDFSFDSKFVIPVIKASKGIMQKIFYPYTDTGRLVSEEQLKTDSKMYNYLISNKGKLLNRSNEKDNNLYWYSFGRSQAINDTYKDKIAINSLIRNENDLKFTEAPAGVGVYGGLYITSNSIPSKDIVNSLKSKQFALYISLLGKYKSGGYYTYSSKDVKLFLDYKFAYYGGPEC